MIQVVLKRKEDNGVQTTGHLYLDGKRLCATLELPWKDNQRFVSCVPTGSYRVLKYDAPSFKEATWMLMRVNERSGILIHQGNFHDQIRGCILVGSSHKDIDGDGQVDVVNSVKTIRKLDKVLPPQFILTIQ
jgi:hypothetical protein